MSASLKAYLHMSVTVSTALTTFEILASRKQARRQLSDVNIQTLGVR